MEPLDSKLLDEGFIRHWATGNKHEVVRSRMIARAPLLAFQLMAFWTLPPLLLLWVVHMADKQGNPQPASSRHAATGPALSDTPCGC